MPEADVRKMTDRKVEFGVVKQGHPGWPACLRLATQMDSLTGASWMKEEAASDSTCWKQQLHAVLKAGEGKTDQMDRRHLRFKDEGGGCSMQTAPAGNNSYMRASRQERGKREGG